MQKTSPPLTSIVVCRNNQGAEITANILRLRRYSVAFEVYNPYSVLQLSEVLSDFRIRVGDQIVYDGKAVVSGLVNTGILLICEVTLSDAWLNVGFLADRSGSEPLGEQIGSFLHDWKRAHEVDSSFKVEVADTQNLLFGLQRWLEQIDLGIRATATKDRQTLEQEVISQVQERVTQEIHQLFDSFEKIALTVPEGRDATHKFYARRQLHPLFLCSPFVYRTFHKPLGYAGDYEMVNMMLRDPFEGGSMFAKNLNNAFLQCPPARAHRNRIKYLRKMLQRETEANATNGRRTNILNLGCGPAREVEEFLVAEELSDLTSFTLFDFNDETIEYTQRLLMRARTTAGRVTPVNFVKRSVHQLIRQSVPGRENQDLAGESYDVVYCAGLFDYLSQRVCARLVEVFYRLLRPGGLLVVTNVSTANPSKGVMEYILEWNLIYRDKGHMMDMIPEAVSPKNCTLRTEETGVNYILEIRKTT
jgi:extracellular factor (EF) 3-hydroxypalmitic acid methyl ester biosynthesis protein